MNKNIVDLRCGMIVEQKGEYIGREIGIVCKKGKTLIHSHPYIKIEWISYRFYDGMSFDTKKYLLHDNLKTTFKVI